MTQKLPPRILSIAGSDSSGGAGIQADIKTITMLGGYAMSAITAVTAQNTCGVTAIAPLAGEVVAAQITACLSDIGADAIKLGMLHDADIIAHTARALEGCTAPQRDKSQLHAAVVEIIVEEDAEVKYSTVQNWYPGDENGKGGIYNFVTKRADCRGDRAKVMWTQVETGSAVTWKYPSCILRGDDSQGEFYSIAITNNMQQADTGTKMVHLGKNTKSRIVSKGISAGKAQNTYRGLVSMHPKAKNSRNYTQCDSLLIGDKCGAHTVPYIEVKNNSSRVEHEATTSKVDDDQLFYCRQRGMDEEEAVALVVNGFCREVLQALPMEFAMEAQQLVAISLEGSVG